MWCLGILCMSLLMARAFYAPLIVCLHVHLYPEHYTHLYELKDKVAVVPLVVGLFLVFFVLVFGRIYTRKLMPLKYDISQKAGKIICKQISRKTIIPTTGQHFFYFDDLKMPYKEVDCIVYAKYNRDDYYPFLVSERSGIQVDGYYNYDLL